MKYHALLVIFEKSRKIWNCRLLQIIGGALRVNRYVTLMSFSEPNNVISILISSDFLKMDNLVSIYSQDG